MARTEGYSRRALEPFFDHFHAATVAGVRAVRTGYPETGHIHRKTTGRSLTRDHIVYDLRGRVESMPGMRVSDRNQTTYFLVDEEFQILVKRATEDGVVALNDNQTALEFQSNIQPDLFDYEVTNLYLSYVENESDPLNPSIYLICPSDDGVYWMFEIEPPAKELGGEIIAPLAPDSGENLIRFPVVKKSDDESE